MDDKYLSVGESSVSGAGRGVFLKTKARKGFTVGFYNGVRLTDIESKVSKCLSIFLYVHILDFFSVSTHKYLYRLTLRYQYIVIYFRSKEKIEKVHIELTMIGQEAVKFLICQWGIGIWIHIMPF